MMAVKRGKRQEATTTVQRKDDGPGLGWSCEKGEEGNS